MATTGSGYVRPAMPMPANASPNHCSPAPSILLNPTGTGPDPRGRGRGSPNASGSTLPNGTTGTAGTGSSPSSSRARSQSAASNSSLASSVPTSSTSMSTSMSTSTSISGDPSPRFAPLPEVKGESEEGEEGEESKGIRVDGGAQNGQPGGGSIRANGSVPDEPESEYSEPDSLAPLSSDPSGSGYKNGDPNSESSGHANGNGNGTVDSNGNPPRPRRGSSVTFAPLPQVPPELKRRSSITLGVAARKNLLTSQGQARKTGVVYMTDEDWELYKKQYEANSGDEPVDLGELVTSGVKSLWRKVRSSSQSSQTSSGSTASASTAPSTLTSTSASASAPSSGRSGIFGRRGSASGSGSGAKGTGAPGPISVPVSGVSGSPPVSPASTASTLATVSEEGSASPVSSPGTGSALPHAHAHPTHPRHPQHPHDAVELLHRKPNGVDADTSTPCGPSEPPAPSEPSAPPAPPAHHATSERRGSAPDVGFASWAPHHHPRGEGHFPLAHSNVLPPERTGTPPATTSTTTSTSTLGSTPNGEPSEPHESAEERARRVEEHRVALGQLGLDGVGEDDGSETPRRPSTPTQRDMRQNAGRLWRTPSEAGEAHRGGQRSAAVLGFDQERYGYSET